MDRLEAALATLHGIYVVRVSAQGRYTSVSPNFQADMAGAAGALVGQPFTATVLPEDVDACRDAGQVALAYPGQVVPVVLRKLGAGGRVHHTRWAFVAHESGEEVVCAGTDVTPRFAVQEFTRRQERLLALVGDTVGREDDALDALLHAALEGLPFVQVAELHLMDGPRRVVRRSGTPPEAAHRPPGEPIELLTGERAAQMHARLDVTPSGAPLVLTAHGEQLSPLALTLAGSGHPGDLSELDLATAATVTALAGVLRDRSRQRHAYAAGQQLFTTLLDHLPDPVSVVRSSGALVYANAAWHALTGHPRTAGLTVRTLLHPQDQHLVHERREVPPGSANAPTVQRWRRADGTFVEVEERGLRVTLPGMGGELYISVARDLTARREAQARIRHLAYHDALTGLANRLQLRETVDAALHGPAALGVTLALLDLDNFKEFNDAFGHQHGDDLLIALARVLSAGLPDGALAARLGGDEFALLFPDATHAEGWLTALTQRLAAPLTARGASVTLQASIGLATAPRDGQDFDALLRAADLAMYRAKGARSGWAWATPRDAEPLRRRYALATDLQVATQRGEVGLVFQPVWTLDGAVAFVEALARWHHPTLGPVPPDEFMPLAEGHGLARALDRHLLALALHAGRARHCAVSVNVGAASLARPDFSEDVLAVLREQRADPGGLLLELTERDMITESSAAHRHLARLRASGVRLALDDFGSGFASLSYLQRLPLDLLKLDRALIAGLPDRPRDVALVRGAISMAHALGLQVVGEGVETAAQWSCLRDLGCDLVQGYLLARPSPLDQLALAHH